MAVVLRQRRQALLKWIEASSSWSARDRVEIHDDLHHGDPCIRGTRIPVRTIIGSLADGMSLDGIREAYPQLSAEDVHAAHSYAAEVLKDEVLIPLNAS